MPQQQQQQQQQQKQQQPFSRQTLCSPGTHDHKRHAYITSPAQLLCNTIVPPASSPEMVSHRHQLSECWWMTILGVDAGGPAWRCQHCFIELLSHVVLPTMIH
jgi:hypothetical protein